MGLFKNYVNQTRKPEGFLGKMMLSGMNSGHAKMADWGLGHLPAITPEKAVDLGCGGGRNAGVLLKKYPNAHVTALDYSALSVEKARKYNKTMIDVGRCAVEQGDVSDLRLPGEAFELATAFETVYFWPGLEKCFAQVAKILKPGGIFLICNESDGTDPTSLKFEKIIDGMKNHTAEDIEGFNLHLECDVSAMENKLGYELGSWVPYMTIDFEVVNEATEKTAAEGSFMVMAASDGPHYGANIALPEAGTYTVRFTFHSPAENGYLVHSDAETGPGGLLEDVWGNGPLKLEYKGWNYIPQEW